MDRFSCRTTVVSGTNALSVLGEEKWERMLLIAEPGTVYGARIRQAAGYPAMEQQEVTTPTVKQAVEGSRKIREFHPDLVVALGDRTVLDCGKAMVCFSREPCTLAAVPAAIGSGSEVTGTAILSHNGCRHLFQDPAMYPAMAILDAGLTEKFSGAAVREGGFELLAAAAEAFAGMNGGCLRDLHAREAFAAAWGALPAACAGNIHARQRLQMAGVLAGMAGEGTEPGLCRAMENSLVTLFGISPGKAAAMLLPAIIGCNAHAAGMRYAELSRAAGLGGSREDIGIRNLKSGLVRLRRELGLPGTLVQAGIDIRAVWNHSRKIVELTLEDPACRNNPVAVDDFMVRRILEEITGRI